MIKANELRRGNLFLGMGMVQTVFEIIDNTNRGAIKVITNEELDALKSTIGNIPAHFVSERHKEMYEVLITCTENGNQYKPVEIKGIILNEEWLAKLGFITDDAGLWESTQEPLFEVQQNNDDFAHVWDAAFTGAPLAYVHNLQNLFFAMKGEELKFKEL